ncbi:MAG: hypothetical protein AUJ85_10275 [Elusimicrobia bacterium CG1_02_37_114]|nr:MAG: hypothetical protein AUJ85_10275 [Elusimicrobia bacterium CG1_02_37_114]
MTNEFKEQLKRMIEKSQQTLKAAKDLLEHNDFDSASSRAYYSVFYILGALLLTKNLSFSKHSAVISSFSRYFVKEGIFPSDFAKKIKVLRKDREIGDYDYILTVDEEKAKEGIRNAEEIIKEIKTYLKKSIVSGG